MIMLRNACDARGAFFPSFLLLFFSFLPFQFPYTIILASTYLGYISFPAAASWVKVGGEGGMPAYDTMPVVVLELVLSLFARNQSINHSY